MIPGPPPPDAERFTPPAVTIREMAEYAVAWYNERTGNQLDPEAFYNASPTGELAHVFDLYQAALCDRERLDVYVSTDASSDDFGALTFVRRPE